MSKREDLTGKKFGKLEVIAFDKVVFEECGTPRSVWLVKCECGRKGKIKARQLKRGNVTECDKCKEQKKALSVGENKTENVKENHIKQTEKKNLSDEGNIMSETESKKTKEIVNVCNSTPSVLENSLPTFAREESDLMNCIDTSNEHLFALMRGLTHDKQPCDIKRVENHVADCAVSIARQIGENLKIKLACIRTAREFR